MIKIYHNSETKYHEYIVKLVLEKYHSNLYTNIQQSEGPDLIADCNKGVEVTRVFLPNEGIALDFFNKAIGKTLKDINKESLNKFNLLGYELSFHPVSKKSIWFYYREALWQDNSEIRLPFEKKLKKCYNIKTDLFIFSPMNDWYDENDITEILLWMSNKQKENRNKFNYVYIFDYKNLYMCNLVKQTYLKTPVESDVIWSIIDISLAKYYYYI